MLILAIRVEIDIVFKMNYRCFLGNRGSVPKSNQAPNEYGIDIQNN